jgi:hypothetical protein
LTKLLHGQETLEYWICNCYSSSIYRSRHSVRARTDDAEYCMGYRSIEAIENGVLGKCDSCGVVAGRHGYQLILLRMHVPARRLARRTDESIDLRAMDSSSSFRESIEYRDVRVRVRSTSRPALNACSL